MKLSKEDYEAIKKIKDILKDEDKEKVKAYELENNISDSESILSNISIVKPDIKPLPISDNPLITEVIKQDTKKISKAIEDKTNSANYQNNKASKSLENDESNAEKEEDKKSVLTVVLVALIGFVGIYSLLRSFGSVGSNSTTHVIKEKVTEEGTENREQKEEQKEEQNRSLKGDTFGSL